MNNLPSDIENLDERISKFKAKKNESVKNISGWRLYLKNVFRIAVDFIAPVIIGFSLGYLFDKFFDTRIICVLIMGMFGCAAGVLNVYRSAQDIQRDIDRSL